MDIPSDRKKNKVLPFDLVGSFQQNTLDPLFSVRKSGDTILNSVMRDALSVMRTQGTRVARGAGSDA